MRTITVYARQHHSIECIRKEDVSPETLHHMLLWKVHATRTCLSVVQFVPGQGEQGQVLPRQQPLSIDQAVERLAGPSAVSSAVVPPPATQDAVLNAFEQAFISGQVRRAAFQRA